MNVSKVGGFIRSQREGAKMSLRKLAKTAGVSNPYLSQIERGLRRPSAEILNAIAKGLRISAQTLYVQAGILDDEPTAVADVRNAVMADPMLTERQKAVLLQIYDSFREETERRRASRKHRTDEINGQPKVETVEIEKHVRARRADKPKTTTRAAKAGGRTESQADPSPHPAPLRSPASSSLKGGAAG